MWLGASDSDEEELWTWSTGDLVMWQGFDGNIPNNRSRNSLVLDRASSAWKDASDSEKHGFVCEADEGFYPLLTDPNEISGLKRLFLRVDNCDARPFCSAQI